MYNEIDDSGSKDFEERLRALQPTAPLINRDRIMYLAGSRSCQRAQRNWRRFAVISWTGTAVLLAFFMVRPPEVVTETRIVTRTVHVPENKDTVVSPPVANAAPKLEEIASPVGSQWGADDWLSEERLAATSIGQWYFPASAPLSNAPQIARNAETSDAHDEEVVIPDRIQTIGQWREKYRAEGLL